MYILFVYLFMQLCGCCVLAHVPACAPACEDQRPRWGVIPQAFVLFCVPVSFCVHTRVEVRGGCHSCSLPCLSRQDLSLNSGLAIWLDCPASTLWGHILSAVVTGMHTHILLFHLGAGELNLCVVVFAQEALYWATHIPFSACVESWSLYWPRIPEWADTSPRGQLILTLQRGASGCLPSHPWLWESNSGHHACGKHFTHQVLSPA